MKQLQIVRVESDIAHSCTDVVAVEEPLEFVLEYWLDGKLRRKQLAITMRTPNDDQALAAGFLWAEGIITTTKSIAGFSQHDNRLTVTLDRAVEPNLDQIERHFLLGSSCGVCGKASIESLQRQHCQMLPDDTMTITPSMIMQLPTKLRAAQTDFGATGGVHAAGLFDAHGHLLDLAEDIGRHNALDKLIGRHVLANNLPLHDKLLLLSGRISFELVQKAVLAGVPVLAAVGAPSSLAIELAHTFNQTLIGFVREQRMNVYCGGGRIRT